jgi:hypothetical protein
MDLGQGFLYWGHPSNLTPFVPASKKTMRVAYPNLDLERIKMYTKLFSILLIASLLLIGCTTQPAPSTVEAPVSASQADSATSVPAAPTVESAPQVDSSATSLSYPIVDTGQGKCYNATVEISCSSADFTGQDAQFVGNAPSYTISADGLSVVDNVTGLIWQRSPDTNRDGVIGKSDKLTLAQAQALPATLNAVQFGGYSDWRLPTIKELYSLIDFRGTDPSGASGTLALTPFIDTNYFPFVYGQAVDGERTIDSQYISSTKYVNPSPRGGEKLFGVNFADGRIKGYDLSQPTGDKIFFVMLVRGNPSYGLNAFVDNGDQTISDNATGLMWAQNDSGAGMNWEEALAWVQAQNAANYLGHNDWRLPNAKELQSLLDYSRSPDTTNSAAIDPVFNTTAITNEAGKNDFPYYWSSTTHLTSTGSGGAAVYVSFGRAEGYWNNTWVDVHGAGAQRSDPKAGDPGKYPTGHGPQGDAIRIYNYVRLVRGGNVESTPNGNPGSTLPTITTDVTDVQINPKAKP